MQEVVILAGTVGSGGTLSDELFGLASTSDRLNQRQIIGLQVPTTFTGTNLGIAVSLDGTTFGPLGDASGVVDIKAAGSRHIALLNTAYNGFVSAKIYTGSAQAQATVFKVIARRP